ncbi:thiosulfate/3-mercaptopyruvate sulfurtransferase [Erythrobacter litoralis]|jgi:thiosulfate/3-mercaptopyruvate sulfurtransferase|uniref:sulfurtransferase n=1 Tax=Erythrobacter TaxID=1041 RepID=UPI0005554DC9|nr:sulfurtransferase [Erythrobacter litoralis]AOL24315.1 thiosulfate/3-mercaptopyruvate sulfurtransferase [Erythrobacter litoralis]MEE4338988.1 sulfurtransferase [Erythrobacter sp.]
MDDFPSLVSTEWLAARLDDESIAVLDASRHLPATGRDPRAEYEAAHIPGARFLDLASLTDPASPVPAALPTGEQVAARLASLGVAAEAAIIVYDDSAVKTSARAWFALTEAGRGAVAILDGGLGKWRAEGRPLESGPGVVQRAEPAVLHAARRVRSKADMLANLDNAAEQVLDARGADRVFGTGEDPVHGGANGRIPGSRNLPYGELFAEDGTFRSPEDLRAAFETAGIDLSRPVVTTCGSGVTASVLLFALHLIGKHDTALYDGSWMEWGADPATPKAQGREA